MRNLIFDMAAVFNDPELGAAIDAIARHCGISARRFLNSTACQLTRAQMLAISRMTPQQQKLELQRARKGRRSFQKAYYMTPLLVKTRKEEPSRQINRAWRLVNKVGASLALWQQMSPQTLALVDLPVQLFDELESNSQTLSQMLSKTATQGHSRPTQPIIRSTKPLSFNRIKADLAMANELIATNIGNMSSMASDLRFTLEQKLQTQSRLAEIASMCGTLRRLAETIVSMRSQLVQNHSI